MGLTLPAAANATIEPQDPRNEVPDFAVKAGGCLATMRANDPVGIMPYLDSGKWTVHIAPQLTGHSQLVPYPGLSVVYWNINDTEPFTDGVMPEACSSLYHELIHAYDLGNKVFDSDFCWDVKKSEIRATRGENEYRKREHRGLEKRKKYNGKTLPPYADPSQEEKPWEQADINKQCAENPTPPPPPPPAKPAPPKTGKCESSSGGRPRVVRVASRKGSACSNGDPHITTFDKHRYDFQAVGEFVLAKADGLEVQARQAPLPNSRVVSVNSAIGLRVGADKLSFAMTDGLRVQLNGAGTIITSKEKKLPGGGTVVFDENGSYLVTWPDGTQADIEPMAPWGLILVLYPPAGHGRDLTAPIPSGEEYGELHRQDVPRQNNHRSRSGPGQT